MEKITPHLWFDKEAKEAAKFYTSVFKGSKINNAITLHNTPSGTVDTVTIELLGQEFMLISAGPLLVVCRIFCKLVGPVIPQVNPYPWINTF